MEDCAWKPGYNKDVNVFQYLFSHSKQLEDFNLFMTHQRLESRTFLDVYPLQEEMAAHPIPVSRALFVDIGGGVGHICRTLKERHPNIPGRIILQDLPPTIEQAPSSEGIEAMAHDYYTPQTIKHAKYYYFRNIMHNLTETNCLRLLEQTKEAMCEDSLILIDEIILPNTGAHWRAMQLDMFMMSVVGAIERTEKQWQQLLDRAGLCVVQAYAYNDIQGDTVMAVAPPR